MNNLFFLINFYFSKTSKELSMLHECEQLTKRLREQDKEPKNPLFSQRQ